MTEKANSENRCTLIFAVILLRSVLNFLIKSDAKGSNIFLSSNWSLVQLQLSLFSFLKIRPPSLVSSISTSDFGSFSLSLFLSSFKSLLASTKTWGINGVYLLCWNNFNQVPFLHFFHHILDCLMEKLTRIPWGGSSLSFDLQLGAKRRSNQDIVQFSWRLIFISGYFDFLL